MSPGEDERGVENHLLNEETDVTKGADLSFLIVRVGGSDDVGAEDDGYVARGHHVLVRELRELDQMGNQEIGGFIITRG